MSDSTYSFRTALGGFHRGDVSEYIASTAAAHQQRINALQDQIARLEEENEKLRCQLDAFPEAPADNTEPEPYAAENNLNSQELAAYRRAEAVERIANQRARKLYTDMQEICDSSLQDFSDSNEAARFAGNSINSQLDIIRTSVESIFSSLDTSMEKLRAVSQFSPDPAEDPQEE